MQRERQYLLVKCHGNDTFFDCRRRRRRRCWWCNRLHKTNSNHVQQPTTRQPGRTYRNRCRRGWRRRWRRWSLHFWCLLRFRRLDELHIICYDHQKLYINRNIESGDIPGNNPVFAPPCPTPLHHPSTTSSICSITSPSTRFISLSSAA